MTFEKYLEELGDVKQPLTTTRLTRLASLTPADEKKLTSFWPNIAAARKERIVRLLIELAEDNVEYDFESIFRLCLEDSSVPVRIAGIEGLYECDESWLIDKLISMLRGDESSEVRAAAATALGRFALLAELEQLPSRCAVKVDEALLGVFNDTNEGLNVRRRAIESIGVRTDEKVVAAIKRAYNSEQQQMRVGAVFAMARNCDEQWLTIILQELRSPDLEMRYEAVSACGELEDERAVPYLIPLLRDGDVQIRISAIIALGHIGGPRAKEELLRYREHPDEQIRDAAEEALEEMAFNDDPLSFGFGE